MESNVLGQSKISTNYQITLPKKVRERFQSGLGDIVLFKERNGKIVIEIVRIR